MISYCKSATTLHSLSNSEFCILMWKLILLQGHKIIPASINHNKSGLCLLYSAGCHLVALWSILQAVINTSEHPGMCVILVFDQVFLWFYQHHHNSCGRRRDFGKNPLIQFLQIVQDISYHSKSRRHETETLLDRSVSAVRIYSCSTPLLLFLNWL